MANHRKRRKGPPRPKPDRIWDSVNNFGALASALNQLPGQLIPLLHDKELMAKIKDQSALASQVRSIVNDVRVYSESLKAIQVKHQGRTGSAKSPDENFEALMVGEDYINWCSQYQGVILPSVIEVLGQIAEVGADANEQAQQLLGEINQIRSAFSAATASTGEDA